MAKYGFSEEILEPINFILSMVQLGLVNKMQVGLLGVVLLVFDLIITCGWSVEIAGRADQVL